MEFAIEGRPLLVVNTHLAYPPELVQERRQSPAVRVVLDSNENFRDVFAECHPAESGYTYSPKKNRYVEPSWTVDERIDYIFANGDFVPTDCSIVFDGSSGLDLVSDHFGVFGNLAFR